MKQGKVWGETFLLFKKNNTEFHRIKVNKGAYCSKHKHACKYNSFFVERGKLRISVWKTDYDLIDETILGPGETMIVSPGEYHQFHAIEETVAFELYWVELDGNDIQREDCGGSAE